MVSINFLEKLSAPSLNCVYGKPGGGGGYRVSFWADSRPDLSRFSGIFPVNVDMAMSACPGTWGEAVTVGWGAGAWDAAAGQAVADAKERNAYGAEVERRMKETPESRRAAFIAAAQSKPRSSDDEDFALAQSIDREIAAMEAGIDGLHSRPFNDKLVNPGGLFDRINRLAQSAYTKAQSLKPGPAGRAAFDAWDERIGGPVMSGVARLEKIVYYRQNRRVRLNEVTADAGAQEMASWGNVDFNPVWTGRALLLEVFTRHLEGQPLIDPTFQRRIAKDLERLRPSGDPGRAYYYHVPAEPRPAWMMTPDEEESQGGKIVANLFAAAVGVGDLIRLIDKVDADIRESRSAFWQCYRVRCQQPGQAFYAYSYAMWAKDNFYFAKPAASAAIVNRGMSFLGEGAIDGGPVPMCAPQANALSGALASAAAQNANDPVGSARRIVAVMKGPIYAGWQACRDRMEYIHRPRF
ncbi:hypothetical protein [Aquincola tertiaricarbonis]|uniref:hypothetical protein n=1 Tax=Aquincola tertiaricarbonis TaxID=391953 RepID=UPI002023862C|nr:hypothetical protein [Aquincola tertiaricarbonis]